MARPILSRSICGCPQAMPASSLRELQAWRNSIYLRLDLATRPHPVRVAGHSSARITIHPCMQRPLLRTSRGWRRLPSPGCAAVESPDAWSGARQAMTFVFLAALALRVLLATRATRACSAPFAVTRLRDSWCRQPVRRRSFGRVGCLGRNQVGWPQGQSSPQARGPEPSKLFAFLLLVTFVVRSSSDGYACEAVAATARGSSVTGGWPRVSVESSDAWSRALQAMAFVFLDAFVVRALLPTRPQPQATTAAPA